MVMYAVISKKFKKFINFTMMVPAKSRKQAVDFVAKSYGGGTFYICPAKSLTRMSVPKNKRTRRK